MGRRKITSWGLPICKCLVEFSWDAEEPVELRKHIIVSHRHCGENHPKAIIGEQLEGSEFHKDFIQRKLAKEASVGDIIVNG